MRKRLLELVPEFNLIQAEELKEKTIQVWEAAMERGGWTPDDLDQMPFTLLINPCPASYIEHVRAVTLTAYRAALLFGEEDSAEALAEDLRSAGTARVEVPERGSAFELV